MKKILCFGDSNTWGHNPVDCSQLEKPWTVWLKDLVPEYEIVPDGVCGRATTHYLENEDKTNGLKDFRERYLSGENDFDLIAIFEEQFARALSPIEINIIKEWKNSNYSDDMIVKALKEAVKSQVFNFRYIERILINWSQNGVKQRYIEQDEPKRTVPVSDYKWWENE